MRSIAIIPAAGHSRRMGRPKLLLPWRGKPVIQHVVQAWRRSRVSHVVVVVRKDDRDLLAALSGLDLAIVAADPPPPHMKDSVELGLSYAECAYSPESRDVWLLAPADMPRLSPETIDALLDQHDPAHPHILIPQAGGVTGHPVLFPWPLASEVARLRDDEGINVLRERFPHRMIPVAAAGFADLDTPEDYRRLEDSS
ncbi:MAG: nucleotidyltransferase family protein [Planctomycetes bacterium]|nr:nucleotidyltransferase family protein [Planctomycetota bacterium]